MTTTVNTTTEKRSSPGLNILLWFLRIVVGCLFIFSGLVKANDPMGLANKMSEFFEKGVWNMPGMMQYALVLSVLMIGFEIIAGVAIILGTRFRIFSFLILLLSVFFLFLTAYVYYWDVIKHSAKVKECGCFGDCIKISNTETFWKDVVLTLLVLVLFLFRKHVRPLLPKYPNTAVMVLTIFFAFGIQWWNLEHLPYHDCMPYKAGTNLWEARQPRTGPDVHPSVYKTMMSYKNLKTGETKKFPSDSLSAYEYIWNDEATWKFDTSVTEQTVVGNDDPLIKDFTLNGYDGTDYTESVLKQSGYTFLLFLKSPAKARTDNMNKLQALFTQCQQNGIPTYVLTSGTQETTEAWQQKWHLAGAEYLTVDLTANKTAMRTDPGLMLLKDGVVQHKWSFRDYPTITKISATTLELK